MLLDCIEGSARQEIVLLQPDGLAFDNYEIEEFFQELLKKFAHEKDEASRKMECTCPGSSPGMRMPGNIILTS